MGLIVTLEQKKVFFILFYLFFILSLLLLLLLYAYSYQNIYMEEKIDPGGL